MCCRRFRACAVLLLSGLLLTGLMARSAGAQPMFGSLSNFDVFNDTGQECHGFEIELDGVTSADVNFTFGSPYQRYGDPHLVDFAGGVYVRYESPYDAGQQAFTATTPLAPSVIAPTDGHACWTGGSGNYLTSGCEHFGMGVNGTPTNTIYRWLVADPSTPGALQPAGTKVSIPAPVWSAAPPAQPGGQPVVRAVFPAPPPEQPEQQYGDAVWVKVFVTETEQEAELVHLVTDDPAVPQDASETEIEWVLLQSGPGGNANNELASEGELGVGKQSITRRYEVYAYTGSYDPESHEALCGGGGGGCDVPQAGDLGNYLGAQMAALNLAPSDATPTPTPQPTVTPTLAVPCSGSCNGDGVVTIDELVRLVDIALGLAAADTCSAGIPSGATVDIAFLVGAVGHALAGCPV